ncbi:S41 family peptidase [uncultured Levyella sp.]|uniref:S41 family peptidase n=1 Tax=uncultured Levyella sp. TaxID=1715800 RepID=UPI00258885E1|nr:S41 family peptidase [uncultured Levyella sp.]
MKKFGKALILVLLLVAVGGGGFILGNNMQAVPGASTEEQAADRRILKNINLYREAIQSDYLFPYKKEDLETGIYKGLFWGLKDPYSEYYTAEEYKRLMEDTTGKFAGVGLVITAGEDNLITVVSPIANTPAAKAGLKAGDKIVEVDGQAYAGKELQEATEHMRGKPKTSVELTVQRVINGKTQTSHVKLVREMIEVDTVIGKLMPDNIGYLQISSFEQVTAKDFKKEWEALEKQGAKKFIIDLRNNPGGLLTSCEEIADALLGKATIVTTVDNKGKKDASTSDEAQYKEPLVVLANGGSASASEILLGALRDNKRAKSVGEKTFGKGIVQQIYPLGENGKDGGFKLTMAEYLTPNGEKIHGKGITPDIVVKAPEQAKGMGPDFLKEDPQLQRALQEVKGL